MTLRARWVTLGDSNGTSRWFAPLHDGGGPQVLVVHQRQEVADVQAHDEQLGARRLGRSGELLRGAVCAQITYKSTAELM